MGGRDEAKGSLDHRKKIEDSEGMCVSEGDYDSCWSRMCNPDRNGALRDVLRGLLVLIALAIVVTIIFLLCFFLLNDMEKKEEALVDSLIEDFTTGNRIDVEPEFSIKGEDAASDKDSYNPLNLPGFGVSDPPDQSHDSKVADFTQQGVSSPQNNAPDSIFTALDPGHSLPPKQDFNPSQSPPDSDLARTDDNSFVSSFVPEPELEEDIFDTVTYFTEEESGAECVPLRLPICSGFMPWTITSFPNFVNNNNMNELQESLKYFQSTIVGSHCSNRAAEYSCAVLEPACGPDAKPLPPCRAFCEDIFSSCSEFLATDNVHNVAFDCNRFPDSKNPNDCVDVSRGQVNHTKEELPQSREAPTATSSSNFGFENPSTSANPDTPLTEVNSEDTVSDVMITKEETPASQTDGANFSDANNEEISTGGEVSVVPALETTKPVEPKTEIGTEAEAGQELTAEPKEESIPVDIFEPTDSTEPPVFICDHTKFLCDDGSDCLFEDSVCDGIQHCLDNSDELNCTQPECTGDDFSCATTKYCIPKSWVCDGADDCRDNSDELNCQSNSNPDSFDEENLLAQPSNLVPGLLSIIPGNRGDPSINLPTNPFQTEKDSPLGPGNDTPFKFDTKVPDEILAGFSKFGGDSERNFGTEDVNEFLAPNEGPEGKMSEDDKEVNENVEDTNSEAAPTGEEVSNNRRNLNLRRRPVRPDLHRYKPRRPEISDSNADEDAKDISPDVPENIENEDDGTTDDDGDDDQADKKPSKTNNIVPLITRRRRPGGLRIPSRRPHYQEFLQRTRSNSSPKEDKTESSDKEESTDSELEPAQETTLDEATDEVPPPPPSLTENRRRGETPFPSNDNDYESYKTRLEPAIRKPPTRRPVSIIRRRPTSNTFYNSQNAGNVELLKENVEEKPNEEVDVSAVAQPITIPERVIPTNYDRSPTVLLPNIDTVADKSDSVSLVNDYDQNAYESENVESSMDYNEPSPNVYSENSEPEYNDYETAEAQPNLGSFSQPAHASSHYDNSRKDYVNPPSQYETPLQSTNTGFNFGAKTQEYEQPQYNYESSHPNLHYPQQTFQQQSQQSNVNSQTHFQLGNFQSEPNAREDYPQPTQGYYETPNYSHQTYQSPSYSENVYHYANPSFPFRRNYQGYNE